MILLFGPGQRARGQAADKPGPSIKPVTLELIIHNGLDGVGGGQVVEDADEDTKGAVTVANLNDTDGDGMIDRDDDDVSVSGTNPPGRKEHDLMKLILEEPQLAEGATVANVRVRVVSGAVELHKPGPAGKEQSKSNGKAPPILPLAAFTTDSNGNGNPDIVWWVEATAQSSLRGIQLAYEYQATAGGSWVTGDTVRATALWVSLKRCFRVRATEGDDNELPENLEESTGHIIDTVTKDLDQFTFYGCLATDGSKYGYGPFAAVTFPGEDNRKENRMIGGRILFEFEVKPKGVEKLGVCFDVTRQKRRKYRVAGNGAGQPVAVNGIPDFQFPEAQDPKKDNELVNDDGSSELDEDNSPNNELIYSFDSPAVPIDSQADFLVRKSLFREWVRVKIGAGFQEEGGDVEAAPQGSRCSDLLYWHLLQYLKRGSDSKWGEDSMTVSASAPVLIGNGNGTATVTVQDDAVTEGYVATYDSGNKKWTLVGTQGHTANCFKEGEIPVGTEWLLSITGQIDVSLVQGAQPFQNGDVFKFSVFRTSSENGKRNVIGIGDANIDESL